jgi:transposase
MCTSTVRKITKINDIIKIITEIPSGFTVKATFLQGNILFDRLSQKRTSSCCPCCGKRSSSIHSSYERNLTGMPVGGYGHHITVEVNKYYCKNPSCPQKVFAHSLDSMACKYGRFTAKAEEFIVSSSLECSSMTASKSLKSAGLSVCNNTCLNHLRLQQLADSSARYVGVDDFSFKKGHTYGSLFVNLQTRRPIDVIESREAADVDLWLRRHPQTQLLSRDGGKFLMIAARGHDCDSIRDRFHLMKDLSENMTDYILSLLKKEKEEHFVLPDATEIRKILWKKLLTMGGEQQRKHLSLYISVHEKMQAGYKMSEIAEALGINPRMITRFKNLPMHLVMTAEQKALFAKLDDIAEYIAAGSCNAKEISKHVQGCTGRQISRLTLDMKKQWREEKDEIRKHNTLLKENRKVRITKKTIFNMLFCDRKATGNKRLRVLIDKNEKVRELIRVCRGFRYIINGNTVSDHIINWIKRAKKVGIPKLSKFAKLLEMDIDAIRNTIDIPFTNGILEGNVNRVKLIEKSMYGKASFGLIKLKILLRNST